MNVDLENIKLAFFDFDDTLAVHEDKDYVKHRDESQEKLIEYFKDAYLFSWNFYTDIEPCKPSPIMQDLVNQCMDKYIKMFCLTGMRVSLHKMAKEMFIMKNYCDDIEVVSAYPQENKIFAVKILAEAYGVSNPAEILIVDDNEKVIELMKKEGYVCVTPQEIEK